jgi:hypothetical protein
LKTYEVIKAVRGSALSSTQRHVLIHVAYRAGDDGECWASATTLGDDTGLSEREVRRTLGELAGLGVLEATPRRGQTAVYRLTGRFPTPDGKSGGSGRHVTPDGKSPRTPGPDTPDATSYPPRTGSPGTPDAMSDDSIQYSTQGLDPGVDAGRAPPRERKAHPWRRAWDRAWEASGRTTTYPWTPRESEQLRASSVAFERDTDRMERAVGLFIAAVDRGAAWKGHAPTVTRFLRDVADWSLQAAGSPATGPPSYELVTGDDWTPPPRNPAWRTRP